MTSWPFSPILNYYTHSLVAIESPIGWKANRHHFGNILYRDYFPICCTCLYAKANIQKKIIIQYVYIISYLTSIASVDFSHLSRYHSVHLVKPLKHNHEALHISQADIATLILLLMGKRFNTIQSWCCRNSCVDTDSEISFDEQCTTVDTYIFNGRTFRPNNLFQVLTRWSCKQLTKTFTSECPAVVYYSSSEMSLWAQSWLVRKSQSHHYNTDRMLS